MQKEYLPNQTGIKILVTIQYLNEKYYYPLPSGVLAILKGDDEFDKFKDCPTFGCLISYGSKQISRELLMLNRYEFVRKVYDKNTDELYYGLSEKGKSFLMQYLSKHKVNLKKHEKIEKPKIVYIKQ